VLLRGQKLKLHIPAFAILVWSHGPDLGPVTWVLAFTLLDMVDQVAGLVAHGDAPSVRIETIVWPCRHQKAAPDSLSITNTVQCDLSVQILEPDQELSE